MYPVSPTMVTSFGRDPVKPLSGRGGKVWCEEGDGVNVKGCCAVRQKACRGKGDWMKAEACRRLVASRHARARIPLEVSHCAIRVLKRDKRLRVDACVVHAGVRMHLGRRAAQNH